MNTPSLQPLLAAATRIRQANYTAWDEFLAALKLRADEHVALAVTAPVERVQLHQGKAQEALDLHKTLSGATQTLEAMATKDRTRYERKPTSGWPG